MKKENYVKAVYLTFFCGLILNLIVVFFLLKVTNSEFFGENHNKIGDFFVLGFLVSYLIMKLIEWPLKRDMGGLVLFIPYVIVTAIFYIFTGTMIGFIALVLKVMGFPNIIYQSLLVTTIVFGVSTVLGMRSNKEPQEHPVLNSVFISGVAVMFINLIFKSNLINIIIDIILLVCVSSFVYYDANKIRSRISSRGILGTKKITYYTYILYDATNLVLDFGLLWEDIADLMFQRQNKDD